MYFFVGSVSNPSFCDEVQLVRFEKKLKTQLTACPAIFVSARSKASATIIYDSTKDPFTDQGLFDKIKGKRNIALIGFTDDGDVFGGFYNVAVTEQDKGFYDPNMFVFSFKSRWRCETPQRFVVKKKVRRYAYVKFYKNNYDGKFVDVGGLFGCFYLGNEQSDTYCHDLSSGYVGIKDNTLTGKSNYESFTCTRIVAVQLS